MFIVESFKFKEITSKVEEWHSRVLMFLKGLATSTKDYLNENSMVSDISLKQELDNLAAMDAKVLDRDF